jgi:methanogenic corrinoid protein MtbC1
MAPPEDDIHFAGTRLGPPRHLCAFFHTLDERYRVLVPFVKEGIDRGEKAVHLVDPARRVEHLHHLRAGGIDVGAAQATGQLEVLGWEEAYLRGGRFDQNATLALVEQVLTEARNQGFPLTRVVGDMEWALQYRSGVGDLIDYEARVNTAFSNHGDPLVCTYDRTKFRAAMAMDVFRVHPQGIIGGVLQENPLFGAPAPFRRRRDASGAALLRDRYLAALLAESRRDALDILVEEGLWLDIPVTSIYLEVLQPVLYEIGRLWRCGRISVVQASLAGEISKVVLAQLNPYLPCEPNNAKRVVVACVEGEFHDIGAHMIADFLEMAGFDVRFLGANVPTESLVALVEERPPQLLALSATTTSNLATLRRAVEAVNEAARSRVPVAAGGQVFAWQPRLRKELDIAIDASNPRELVEAARTLLNGIAH